jgi:hypothetical protein
MADDPKADGDAPPVPDAVVWSESEVSEAIEEISERAQSALTPHDRRADYSSIAPRNARQAA